MPLQSLHSLPAILRHRAFIALVDQAAVSIASFGTGILLSRALAGNHREQLGLYYLAVTIGILIVEIQNALVSTPLTVISPTLDPGHLKRFIGSALIHQAWLSIAITFALIGFAALAPTIGIPSHRPMLFACSITSGAIGLRNFARFLNYALHRPHIAAVTDWVVTLLQLGGVYLLVRLHHLTAATAVGVIGFASVIGGILALQFSRQFIQPRVSIAWSDFRGNWKLSRWVFASGVIGNAGTSMYSWVVDRLSSTLQVAVWGNCSTVASAGNPVFMGLQNWMAPAIAHACTDRSREKFKKYVTRLAGVFMLILPPILLGLAVVTTPLLHRVYRDFTPNTFWLVMLFAAGSLVQSSGFIFTRGLFSLGRGEIDVWTNVVPLIVLLVAGVPLVQFYGAIGGAASLLLAQILSAGVRGVLFWRVCTDRPDDLVANQTAVPALVEAA